mgnify:CR=1 FL=1
MGLKRRGKGPFRGPSPSNVFQTVDVGTGRGNRLESIAKRFPKRKYVAVEKLFKDPEHDLLWSTAASPRIPALKKAGVVVRPQELRSFIDYMERHGQRTRYINFDMPIPGGFTQFKEYLGDRYGFRKLFANVPKILLPNGKIFVKTENLDFVDFLQRLAKRHGLKTRPPLRINVADIERSIGSTQIIYGPAKQLTPSKLGVLAEKAKKRAEKRFTGSPEEKREKALQWSKEHSEAFGGHPITSYRGDKFGFYLLEITYGLKKAIPNQGRKGDVKKQRRNWPRQ